MSCNFAKSCLCERCLERLAVVVGYFCVLFAPRNSVSSVSSHLLNFIERWHGLVHQSLELKLRTLRTNLSLSDVTELSSELHEQKIMGIKLDAIFRLCFFLYAGRLDKIVQACIVSCMTPSPSRT